MSVNFNYQKSSETYKTQFSIKMKENLILPTNFQEIIYKKVYDFYPRIPGDFRKALKDEIESLRKNPVSRKNSNTTDYGTMPFYSMSKAQDSKPSFLKSVMKLVCCYNPSHQAEYKRLK